ncbi:UbiH/UbiF/VisC/COQ6 family ubiquinone biosynthesis hydroxylase [Thiohalorhabdus sp.]|uniref:UbiH/UbiF/VisC/COQ6 family ubiquinone biosynthesis hydroxylase n=1 Tax=Thiohalorhabdus sp. TaxID=3094134 RepID=UPI002FC35C51
MSGDRQQADDYDLIVVGGGMVGAAIAAALAPTPLWVAVVEARAPEAQPASDGRRVSALTAGSVRILKGLGVWQTVAAGDTEPIRAMTVWDGDQAGGVNFEAGEVGLEALGALAPNGTIAAALHGATREGAHVDWFCPARWTTLEPGDEAVTLNLTTEGSERTLRAPLAVAADGRDSAVRQEVGIATGGWDYGQSGLVAEIRPQRPHRGRAFQRFLRGGPLALLPLSEGRCSMVWSLPTSRAEGLLDLEDAAFGRRLQQAFGPDLGELTVAGPRAAFPLRLQHARAYARNRVALAGDAAHAVHPLAGLGLNLGLRDAAALAETVAEAHLAGEDWGETAVLGRYQRRRMPDNLLVSAYTDGFHRLFGGDSEALATLRSLGMNLVDRAGPLKHLLMRQGMGLAGLGRGRLERGEPLA